MKWLWKNRRWRNKRQKAHAMMRDLGRYQRGVRK